MLPRRRKRLLPDAELCILPRTGHGIPPKRAAWHTPSSSTSWRAGSPDRRRAERAVPDVAERAWHGGTPGIGERVSSAGYPGPMRGTVRAADAYGKIGAHNKAEATAYPIAHGLR